MTQHKKDAEILPCKEVFEAALKDIAGMTLDKDIAAIHLRPDTLFKLWQAAYNHNPAIKDNSGLVREAAEIMTMFIGAD